MLPMMGQVSAPPALDLSFLTGALDPRITFTRASAASYFDATGTLQLAATNAPRFDYGATPGAQPLGLLIEESRTNSIRNPRAEGSAVPATLPTNWSNVGNNTANLVTNVIGSGVANGLPYVDLQIVGTPVAAVYAISSEQTGIIAAASGQSWAVSAGLALVGGSIANVASIAHRIRSFSSAAAPTEASAGANLAPALTGVLQRFSESMLLVNAGTASVINQLLLGLTAGAAVNLTLRWACPQLELGAFATSIILPPAGSPAATARAADVALTPASTFKFVQGGPGAVAADYMVETATPPGSQYAFEINDGTASNRYALQSGPPSALTASGGVTTASGNLLAASVGSVAKIAMSWNGASQTAAGNGGAVQSTASAAPVGSLLFASIGESRSSGLPINGWVRRIRYWPRALSNRELQQVTT